MSVYESEYTKRAGISKMKKNRAAVGFAQSLHSRAGCKSNHECWTN